MSPHIPPYPPAQVAKRELAAAIPLLRPTRKIFAEVPSRRDSRDVCLAEVQPRYSRGAAEVQPRYSTTEVPLSPLHRSPRPCLGHHPLPLGHTSALPPPLGLTRVRATRRRGEQWRVRARLLR